MRKKNIFLFFLIFWLSSVVFSADPFYTNLLNQGKSLYLSGKYDEALEDFKIAEFGLLDEKEFVPELFFYYALAHYKKGAVVESKALLEKLETILNVSDINKLPRPKEIEHDLSIMVRALDYLGFPDSKPGSLAFFNLFYETWDLLKEKKLPEAEANLKRLNKIGDDKARLAFLEGYLAFQQKDYKKCAKRLEKALPGLPDELSEDARFYLAYSCFQRGDLADFKKYAAKIKKNEYLHELMLLADKIKAGNQKKSEKK